MVVIAPVVSPCYSRLLDTSSKYHIRRRGTSSNDISLIIDISSKGVSSNRRFVQRYFIQWALRLKAFCPMGASSNRRFVQMDFIQWALRLKAFCPMGVLSKGIQRHFVQWVLRRKMPFVQWRISFCINTFHKVLFSVLPYLT